MDKNTIHIDDLVRQRLNGEEKGSEGAWLNMRELLDKNMPTRRAAVFGWRKTFLSAAIIAGICTLGIGGYEVSSSFRGVGGGSDGGNTHISAEHASVAANGATETPAAETANDASMETVSSDEAANNTATVNSSVSSTSTNTSKVNAPVGKKDIQLTPSNSNTQVATNTKNTNATSSNTSNTSINKTATEKVVAKNTNNNTNVSQPQHTTSPTGNTNTSNSTSTIPGNSKGNDEVAQQTPAKPSNQRSGGSTSSNETAPLPVVKTVPATEVLNQTTIDPRTGIPTFTSTETGQTQIEIKEPAIGKTNEAIKTELKENEYAAAVPAFGPPEDKTPGMTASESKTETENKVYVRKHTSTWLKDILEAIDPSQYEFGKVKMNTGAVIGANSTFGRYNLVGFNVGMFADIFTNDKWSIRAEAKYMQRFNKITNTYSDNYITYTPNNQGGYNKEATKHYFKYATASSINLPLVFTYNIQKFYMMLGPDFAYFFNITAEEYKETSTLSVVNAPGTSRIPMTSADFNSRFGMGYVLGMGYQIAPMLQLDLRVSQTLMDNAKTPGAQKVSRDIYYKPNFQLSFSYRFGKDKRSNSLIPGGN